MLDFWNTAGTLMTQFLKGLTAVWEWLTTTQIPFLKIPVIAVFGAGFVTLIAYTIIRSLTV